MRFTNFILQMLIAQSGVSSKRVCGVVGWLFTIGWITYYIIVKKDMPDILETFVVCTIILLGVDTIPKSIDTFRKYNKNKCESKSKDDGKQE